MATAKGENKIDWDKKNREDIQLFEGKVIPWIESCKMEFDVKQVNNIKEIYVEHQLFEEMEYDYSEVSYQGFANEKMMNLTIGKWKFFVKVNVTPIADVVREYFKEELENPMIVNIEELYKRIWSLIRDDSRNDYRSRYFYFQAIVGALGAHGFDEGVCDMINNKILFPSGDNAKKIEKDVQDSTVITLNSLMARLKTRCAKATNETLTAIELKRQEMREKQERKRKELEGQKGNPREMKRARTEIPEEPQQQ